MEQGTASNTLPAAAISALHRGNKIEAIKVVRAEQGLDLKDAKDLVEAYLKANPSVRSNFSAAQGQSGGHALLWLAALIAAAAVAYFLFGR